MIETVIYPFSDIQIPQDLDTLVESSDAILLYQIMIIGDANCSAAITVIETLVFITTYFDMYWFVLFGC